jgi:hypothetical protein
MNQRGRRTRPCIELLEDRLAPAVDGNLAGTTLTVTLDAPGDHAFLRINGTDIEVDDNASSVRAASPKTSR